MEKNVNNRKYLNNLFIVILNFLFCATKLHKKMRKFYFFH